MGSRPVLLHVVLHVRASAHVQRVAPQRAQRIEPEPTARARGQISIEQFNLRLVSKYNKTFFICMLSLLMA